MLSCMRWAVLLCLALAALPASAEEQPRAYACTFSAGTALTYDHGQFASRPAEPLSFEIADIALGPQTAKLVTPRGLGSLRAMQAMNAVHFIEVVTEGFLNLTTIYDRDETKGLYPAVHSRHFGLFGQPLVSQYEGFCKAK